MGTFSHAAFIKSTDSITQMYMADTSIKLQKISKIYKKVFLFSRNIINYINYHKQFMF